MKPTLGDSFWSEVDPVGHREGHWNDIGRRERGGSCCQCWNDE